MSPEAKLLIETIIVGIAVLAVIAAATTPEPRNRLRDDLETERDRMLKRAERQVIRDANMIERMQHKGDRE